MNLSGILSAFNNLGIAWRLILCIAAGVSIVMGLILGGSHYFVEEILSENLAKYVHSMAQDIAGQTGDYLQKIEYSNKALALEIEKNKDNKEKINTLLKTQLSSSDIVFGVCVSYEPFIVNGVETVPDFTYVYYGDDKVEIISENPYASSYYAHNNTYIYERQWYSQVKKEKSSVWSEPYSYTDLNGETTLVITCGSPIFRDGNFAGVVGTDVSMKWFKGGLGSWILKKVSFGFILSPQGEFLVNTSEEFSNYRTIYEFAAAQQNELLSLAVENIAAQKPGFVEIQKIINGQAAWFIYLPIPESGWTLGIFVPKYRLTKIAGTLAQLQLVLGGVGFVLLFIIIGLLVRTITGPLRELNNSVQNIAQDIDSVLPDFAGNNEVAVLARSYKAMVGELKINMQTLEAATAAREKIESELRIARSIQMGLVPKTFPAFPQRCEFDIYAVLHPAREVGGDFYDYFLLDDEHLCLVIGDVSGKGIPAAIFMAVVRTLVQAFVKNIREPGELLQAVNDELLKNNENCMFVTLFCAVVHLPSGQCRFANGGHNLPLFIAGEGMPTVTKLPKLKGCLVGVLEGGELFAEGVFTLRANSTLFLYTDGITEAENQNGEFYGEERLLKVLGRRRKDGCIELIQAVQQDVATFAAGYEQSDDITAVAFLYRGREIKDYDIKEFGQIE